MPKPRFVVLNVPEPCSVRLDEMPATENSKYCTFCRKSVTDFTTWTDVDLAAYISRAKGRICGRFLATQLGRPLHIPYQPASRLYRLMAGMGLLLILATAPQNGFAKAPLVECVYEVNDNDDLPADSGGDLIGSILNPHGEPITGVKVTAYRANKNLVTTVTDNEGTYSFKDIPAGSYEVCAESNGYKTFYFNNVLIQSDKITSVNFKLEKGEDVVIKAYMPPIISGYSPGYVTDTARKK